MNLTKIIRPYFVARANSSLAAARDFKQSQLGQLKHIVHRGRHTTFGRSVRMEKIATYDDFAAAVEPMSYERLRPYVMRMIGGETNLLWPGKTRRFAQSSGTSDGKSKFIPVTDESLRANHYRGGFEAVAHYLRHHPESRLFDGKAFILGGSFANELDLNDPNVKVGDLSAHLIDRINPLVERLRVPARATALMADWQNKLPRLVEESKKANVTNISGVPSWFLTVLRRVIAAEGVATIHDVWPRLEVFFHGGIAFGPYRSMYESITDGSRMNYVENYNASEGFFAVQNEPDAQGMMLLTDAGVFYELQESDDSLPIPLWDAEPGKTYSLLITAVNGLWRYPIGDVVKIESMDPPTITIAGRTKCFINAFGEEVMVHNTDAALTKACEALRCHAVNYTAAPVFTTETTKGHHQWLIEFDTPPADVAEFARVLDSLLQQENSDYQAKRASNIFLAQLTVEIARSGLFDHWLASTGKLGGQRKVPRLANDRHLIEPLLKQNQL